jgi:hypothetical protein
VKNGAREERWYSKPVLFSPRRVESVEYSCGAHTCTFRLRGQKDIQSNPTTSNIPPTYLLHFHQLGGIERIAARYDATLARLSQINRQHRWGNLEPGLKHALAKREALLQRLERVIA